MGEKVLVQQRCLAVQLLRGTVVGAVASPNHHHQPASPTNNNSSSEDTTPTPTNCNQALTQYSADNPPHPDHQDGYLLFLAWQAANVACVWDGDLVRAAGSVEYVGHLVGGVVLVGGPGTALATLTHAWSRSLLAAPPGYTLAMLGEVRGWGVVKVAQGQFTPLSEALCWVVHHLTREGGRAESEAVQASLRVAFPTLTAPDSSHIHTTLSNLIRQCKVYYSGSSYGIVHPDTYQPRPPSIHQSISGLNSPVKLDVPPPDGSAHTASQTDLAELITGLALPTDTIITPTFPGGGHDAGGWLRAEGGRRHTSARTASLRLSPTRAARLASTLAATTTTNAPPFSPTTPHHRNIYRATNTSDVTVKGERGSMLSKLLLPSRRRLATCSVQFPPPEWTDPTATTRHLHSVSTQTVSLNQVSSTSWVCQQWTPRSATLPRRLRPPKSASPSPSPPRHPQSATPPPNARRSLDNPPTASRNFARPQASFRSKHHSPSHHKNDSHRKEKHVNDIHVSPSHHKYDSHRKEKHINDIHVSPSHHKNDSHRKEKYVNYIHVSPSHHKNDSHRKEKHINDIHLSPSHHKNDSHRKEKHINDIHVSPSHHKNDGHRKEKHLNEIHKSKAPKNDPHISISSNNHIPGQPHSPHYQNMEYHRSHTEIPPTRVREVAGEEELIKEDRKHHQHTSKSCRMQDVEANVNSNTVMDSQQSPGPRKQNKGKKYNLEQNNKNPGITQCERPGESVNAYEAKPGKNKDDRVSVKEKEGAEEPEKVYDRSTLKLPLVLGPGSPSRQRSGKDSSNKSGKDASNKSGKNSSNRAGKEVVKHSGKADDPEHKSIQHMNNCRKVARSPQHRPQGLTTNLLHITKGSSSDLTSRNLGYQEVDKCHKKSCSQTLDQAHLNQSPDTSPDSNVDVIVVEEGKGAPDQSWEGGVKVGGDDVKSPEAVSVNTYPSLTDLNLTFTSLAAQKILAGGSVNSLDTLAEVNLAARKHNKTPVTNTDFGFL